MIVVEGAEALELGAGGAQRNVIADDFDNIVSLLDLGYLIVRQWPPARMNEARDPAGEHSTHEGLLSTG